MDKTIEPIAVEWKEVAERMAIRAQEQGQDRKRKTQLEKAAKTLGWEISENGIAMQIKTSKQDNQLQQKHVREVAIPVVKENPGITKADLETFVSDKLSSETDLDMRGIGLRWKEVWKSGVFNVGANGTVSIASVQSTDSSMLDESRRNLGGESPVENQAARKKVG